MPAAVGQAASGSTAPSGDPAPATASAATSTANCPPPKVIVRQGGTSEPSIQLAGGADPGQTSNQRDTANQMLDATEANLKKLAGKQLTPNQQDMVSQTRQFMQQSKAAVEAGDLERARTLAWKAQVLSEELVKPKE
jgi:iron uptake system EfeUOB component EfeO/EfeM